MEQSGSALFQAWHFSKADYNDGQWQVITRGNVRYTRAPDQQYLWIFLEALIGTAANIPSDEFHFHLSPVGKKKQKKNTAPQFVFSLTWPEKSKPIVCVQPKYKRCQRGNASLYYFTLICFYTWRNLHLLMTCMYLLLPHLATCRCFFLICFYLCEGNGLCVSVWCPYMSLFSLGCLL